MKVAIMADGPVGRAIVALLLAQHSRDVCAVVTDDTGASAEEITALCGNANVKTFRWAARAGLTALEPDVLLLAWWPHLLDGDDFALAPIILNTHPSLLPHCRGKDPNYWTLAEGRPFGVTIHHVEAEIDAGPIAFQKSIPVSWEDTGASLYRAAERAMIELVEENWHAIRVGDIPRRPQNEAAGSFHHRAELDSASHIDLDAPTTGRSILNRVRARTFAQRPACWFEDDGGTYEVRIQITRVGSRSERT